MALNTSALGNSLINAMLNLEVPRVEGESITLLQLLKYNARQKFNDESLYTELPEYKQLEDTWNTIAEQIINHIKNNAEVMLAESMHKLKDAFESAVVVANDGGASLLASIKTSSWYIDQISDKVR